MSDMEPTSRRSLLKMFGVGTAALILPSKDLVIPATAVDNPDPTVYNNSIFVTGDHASFAGCKINGNVVIVGNYATLTSTIINYSGNKAAVTFENALGTTNYDSGPKIFKNSHHQIG